MTTIIPVSSARGLLGFDIAPVTMEEDETMLHRGDAPATDDDADTDTDIDTAAPRSSEVAILKAQLEDERAKKKQYKVRRCMLTSA